MWAAGCSQQARRKGHEGGRAAAREDPAWRGRINRRGAQRHLRTLPSGTRGSWCLALILAACQAGLGQEGVHREPLHSLLPPAGAEANLASDKGGTGEGAGGQKPRLLYCTVLGAVSLVGEGNDLGTGLRRLRPLVHNTSVGLGTAGPHMPPPQDKLQGRRSHSQCPLPLARAVQTWPCINIPEGSSVSPGCPLGRQQLAVHLEAICECLWSNTWKGNANAVPACFLAWT